MSELGWWEGRNPRVDGPCLGPLSWPHQHSSVCSSSSQPPPQFSRCPLRPKENENYFTHRVSLWICFHPFPNTSSSPLIRCKLTGKKKKRTKEKKGVFSPLTRFLVTGEIHYCMPLAVPSFQISDFRGYMDALSEKSLTKIPWEGTLFLWDYSHYRQKQKFASPYHIHLSILPWAGLLLETGETD